MNAKKFSDAMSELDTKYVDEALNYKKKAGKKKKKQNWTKWGAMAACLCLVIIGAFALPRFIGNDTPDTPPAIEENAYCSNSGHRKNFCIYPCKRRALQNRANW